MLSVIQLIRIHFEMKSVDVPANARGVFVSSPGVLNCDEVAVCQQDAGKLLVKNEYSGVNFIDLYHRDGTYKVKMPHVLGRYANV